MLQLNLIVIGKTNESYVKEAISKYKLLLSKYCKFEIIELADVKNGNKLPPEKLKQAEAELIKPYLQGKSIRFYWMKKVNAWIRKTLHLYFEKQSVLIF
jgi:23S rRNA pseudoU1915 N3-methylase RlmH